LECSNIGTWLSLTAVSSKDNSSPVISVNIDKIGHTQHT